MARSGDINADIIEPLWMIGWYAKETFVGLSILWLISFFTGIPGWMGWLAFLGAFLLSPAGLIYVRNNWEEVRDIGVQDVEVNVSKIVNLDGGNIARFSLIDDSDSDTMLPAEKHGITTLLVEDSLLMVHTDATVNLARLRWEIAETTTEYYYDQITNIGFEPAEDSDEAGEFTIQLSGGHSTTYNSSREPGDALNEIQRRIREYKKVAT